MTPRRALAIARIGERRIAERRSGKRSELAANDWMEKIHTLIRMEREPLIRVMQEQAETISRLRLQIARLVRRAREGDGMRGIVIVLCALFTSAAIAEDRRVVIMQDPATLSAEAGVVRVLSGEIGDRDELIRSLISGAVDAISFPVPEGACDDSTDCDRELKATCQLLGGRVEAVDFSSSKKRCSGTCTTGHAVSVVCVTPR